VRIWILALVLGAAFPHTASATGTVQALDDIRAAVRRFVVERMASADVPTRVEVGQLDPRLRLSPCGTRLEAFFPSGIPRIGNMTVGVRCTEPSRWSLYVPVTARRYRQVLVAARPLTLGESLTARDLVVEERDEAKLIGGFFTAPEQVVGKRVVRSLGAGQALIPDAVAAPMLVRRGQRVVLTAHTAGMDVQVQGEALNDGAAGDRVSVRNLGSKRVVEGEVTAQGTVQVLM